MSTIDGMVQQEDVMRRMMVFVSVLVLAIASYAGSVRAQEAGTPPAASQDARSAFAHGMNRPAVLYSERGGEIATLTVTGIERGWADYSSYSSPDAGKEYIAVTFEVSMQSRGSLAISPYGFTLFDGWGMVNPVSWVTVDDGSDVTILSEDQQVASGETASFTVVFQVYEDAPLAIFTWQPGYSTAVMVDISDAG
ncbi:MAG TPA: hypothetical protein VNZ58_09745 [Thermomicrobiales bacterium]|nr:hypothetical protein [Thermomicrobiales bacterium]